MFHAKLIDLELELLAKEEAARGLLEFPYSAESLLQLIEGQIGARLASQVPKDWRGWICYRRHKNSLVVLRGRAFKTGGLMGGYRAGLDVNYGADAISEYQRGYDVSPPQDLDHLLLNFGGQPAKVFLWYGENIAAYKLIFESVLEPETEVISGVSLDEAVHEAIAEACVWILTKPKNLILTQFLKQKKLED